MTLGSVGSRRKPKLWQFLGAALTAMALLVATAIPAAAAEIMRVTFIRHGESAGNASGLIDSSTPGPVLTDLGQQQAKAVASALGDNNYDAIYASQMVRTQLTAAPMSQYLGMPIHVLPGLQEVEAGDYEGTPEADAPTGYGLVLINWATGIPPYGIPQDKSVVMPGTDLDGYKFDARVRGALQTIYDNGDRNAAVFSHGGVMTFWTLMNVTNLTPMEKFTLLSSAAGRLNNTDSVVIEGNNEDGWTLVRWKDQQFSPEPTFWNAIKLQKRTLNRQLSAAWQQVTDAFATHDWSNVATAVNHAIADATISFAKYHRAINVIVQDKIKQIFTPKPATPAPTTVVADTSAGEAADAAAPQSIAPAADPAPTAKVSSLSGDNKVVAKSEAKVEAKVEVEAAGVAEDTTAADNGKPARADKPSHKVRDTAAKSDDDQAGTSTPKRSDVVKKSKKAKTSTGSDAGSSDTGSQQDAA